jgi:hypothetical protein
MYKATQNQKYTGASWTHQHGGVRKQIWRLSCQRKLAASKWVVVAKAVVV